MQRNDCNSVEKYHSHTILHLQEYSYHFKIPKQVPFTFNAHIAKMLLPRKITHLLVRFEKHMVDSEHRLHFVPSMIKFHSPVKQRKRENEMSTHNQRRSKKKMTKFLNVIY